MDYWGKFRSLSSYTMQSKAWDASKVITLSTAAVRSSKSRQEKTGKNRALISSLFPCPKSQP